MFFLMTLLSLGRRRLFPFLFMFSFPEDVYYIGRDSVKRLQWTGFHFLHLKKQKKERKEKKKSWIYKIQIFNWDNVMSINIFKTDEELASFSHNLMQSCWSQKIYFIWMHCHIIHEFTHFFKLLCSVPLYGIYEIIIHQY